jgi:6-pyruvoyltetrahydropterin/6-carboxytetrahydropterin synthase
MYHVSKHYPHSLGLSAAFRQHRARSHCHFIHGYALAFTYDFEALTLDANNWVLDFGSLKPIKAWLEENFDHRLMVAEDDPNAPELLALGRLSLAHPKLVKSTGCEAFAEMAFSYCKQWLSTMPEGSRVRLVKVTCAEHDGNNASYSEPGADPIELPKTLV